MEQKTVIQLLTDGGSFYLDLVEDQASVMVLAAGEIRDLSSKKGETGKVWGLAGTANNHKVLNFLFDINTIGTTLDEKKAVTCLVIQNGTVLRDNMVFQLTKVVETQGNTNDKQIVSYECITKDQTAMFYTKLGNKELTDLNLEDLNHTYSSGEVVGSWSHTVDDGYKYPLPLTDSAVINLQEFRPAVYTKVYFDRIFAAAGFSYQWDEMDDLDTRFSKRIVLYNGEVPQIREEVAQLYEVLADEIAPLTLTGTGAPGDVAAVVADQVPVTNVTKDDVGSYNPVTSVYTSPLYYLGGGSVSFKLKVSWELRANNSSGATAYLVASNPLQDFGVDFKPQMYLGKNGSLTNAGVDNLNASDPLGNVHKAGGFSVPAGLTVLASGSADVAFAGTLTTNTTTYKVAAGATVAAGVTRWRNANTTLGALVSVGTELEITSVELVIEPSMSELAFGQMVYMNDFIPKKVKQSDFIRSIFTEHNLMIQVDQFNSNKLVLKSRNKYYDDGAQKDWTKLLAKDQPQETVFLPTLTNKKIVLTYKEDGDEPNQTYKDATNEVYGQVEYTFDSEHVKDVDVKELLFSPTPVTLNTFGAVVPMIAGAAPRTNIRQLYDGGLFDCQSFMVVDYVDAAGNNVGNTQTQYGLMSHFDKPFDPTFDVMFATNGFYFYDIGKETNNTAYNRKYRRTLNQMNEGRMLSAWFDLDEEEISKLKLSDKIFVGNCWYSINNVEYDVNHRALSKVELVTADTEIDLLPLKTKKPVHPAPGDTVLGPVRQVLGQVSLFNNVVLSNSPIMIFGANNLVSKPNRGGVVIGDGNTVNTPKALVIGDGMTADQDGLYTPGLFFPDGTSLSSVSSITNYFTGNQQQNANRLHDGGGFYVGIEKASGFYWDGNAYPSPFFASFNVRGFGSLASNILFDVVNGSNTDVFYINGKGGVKCGDVDGGMFKMSNGTATAYLQERVGSPGEVAVYANVTPGANNYVFRGTAAGANGQVNGSASSVLQVAATNKLVAVAAQAYTTTGTGFGVNTNGSALKATFEVLGSAASVYAPKTANYTLTASDSKIDVTSGSPTLTLPTAVGCAGREYWFKNSGTGTVTINTTSSQTIDGVTTKTISVQYGYMKMVSDGANWKVWG